MLQVLDIKIIEPLAVDAASYQYKNNEIIVTTIDIYSYGTTTSPQSIPTRGELKLGQGT